LTKAEEQYFFLLFFSFPVLSSTELLLSHQPNRRQEK
jgi:hypothetical protein